MARGAQEPADAARPSRLRLRGRLPGAAVLVGGAVMLGAALLACGTALPTPSPSPGGPGVGDTAQLADGALARLNGVETGVQLPGSPSQEPGMRLDRLDVEVCAGRETLFVDAAFWNGVGSDRAVHSAYMGVRSFFTLSLTPGSCQRGPVELVLPEGVELQSVLLMDAGQTTAARWSVEGQAAGEIAPLASSVTPRVEVVGASVELEVGGTATVHSIDAGTVVAADAELCAADQPLPTSPRHWFLRLADNHLQPAGGGAPGSAAFAGTIAARDCARGTLGFAVAPGATPVSVLYAYGGQFEQGAWAVDR